MVMVVVADGLYQVTIRDDELSSIREYRHGGGKIGRR